jgi:hypothetical protein
VGIRGQASASLEIRARDGSSFDGPKGLYYGVEAPSLWKPPPAKLNKLSSNQPTNQSPITNQCMPHPRVGCSQSQAGSEGDE